MIAAFGKPFQANGGKACAWLIYKSAAKLTVRLTPHRHPRAARSGAEAKRTAERTNKRETDRKRGGREAAPLIRLGRAFAFSRHA